MGISCGDFLLSVNGHGVFDVLDYRFRIQDQCLLIEVEKPNGEVWEIDIEKDPDMDLGINFKHSLMSYKRRCRNKCIFCFVDQQPKGLRPSLYIKDDDPRLSFLQGNYVTLTNLSQTEIKRLASYHLSPLRISVQVADLDMREKLMGTPAARNLFTALQEFNQAGIEMHFQVVLCKGINDGTQLDSTIEKLINLKPGAKSMSIVPAGLTKHRCGLYPLQPFTKEDARTVIAQVAKWQQVRPFVYLSDEWYVIAGERLPQYAHYGEFPQLDNGVGMVRLFEREFKIGMAKCNKKRRPLRLLRRHKNIGIITGQAAAGFMRALALQFMHRNPHIKITVYVIRNDFFGESVTVSGLITGQDVVKQLRGKLDGINEVFLPENAFRAGVKEKVMLDGMTLQELEKKLEIKVKIGSAHGEAFYKQLSGHLTNHQINPKQ